MTKVFLFMLSIEKPVLRLKSNESDIIQSIAFFSEKSSEQRSNALHCIAAAIAKAHHPISQQFHVCYFVCKVYPLHESISSYVCKPQRVTIVVKTKNKGKYQKASPFKFFKEVAQSPSRHVWLARLDVPNLHQTKSYYLQLYHLCIEQEQVPICLGLSETLNWIQRTREE